MKATILIPKGWRRLTPGTEIPRRARYFDSENCEWAPVFNWIGSCTSAIPSYSQTVFKGEIVIVRRKK